MNIDANTLHARLLEMMKSFHTFCVENNIAYYMLGGTCLGARRHKGFIPWDDDMDIGIPRNDYDRLCNELVDKLPSFLELRYYKNAQNSPMHYAKLIDNRTTLIEQNYHDYVEGLYIDIFPLDDAVDKRRNFFEKLRWRKIWFHHSTIIYHCMTTEKQGFIKVMAQKWARAQNLDRLHLKIERAMIAKNGKNTNMLANFLGAWGEKEIVSKEIMGKPTLYQFEDSEFYGPENIESYLTGLYGDFMKLPPEEKRVFRHDYYYLDFDTPYRDFINQNKTTNV